MKPIFLITVAVVALIGIAAIAFAASGGGDNDDRQTAVTSQTPTPPPDNTAAPLPSPDESPIPVEPDGGIGTTPDDDTPIPVEPDGGIGTTPDDDTPIPVEPDGGIGTTPDADKPIPTEPIIPVTPAPALPTLPAGRYAEAAPIDGLDISVAESFPPQYFLHVLAGLPSGCAEQYTHSVTRNGNQIEVAVLNSFPQGNPVCTAIYGQYELNIALGSDFSPGEKYTVSVNGGAAELEFTAQ